MRLEWLRNVRQRREIANHLRHDETIPFELRDRQLMENFGAAASQYRPQPWSGHALLFRAASANFVFSGGGHSYGWDKVIKGGIETVVISGDHDTLLLGPNSLELMEHLNKALETAVAPLRGQQPAASQASPCDHQANLLDARAS